jgi:hypothetical protein
MPAEDEFRKVAEDVRELARTLRSELRTAKWEAKDAARQARREWRAYYRSTGHDARHQHWQGYNAMPPAPPTDAPPSDAPPGARPPTGWGEWVASVMPHPPTSAPQAPPRPPGTPVYYPRPPRHQRPPKPPSPPKVKRNALPPVRHRRDGSTLMSLLLVILGLAWLGSETGAFTISLEAALAVLLAVLGAVMVVTARTDWGLSRKHWPVWLGMGLLVVLLVSANGNAISSGLSSLHFGPVSSSPIDWNDARGTVSNLAGPVTVDLTQLTAGRGNETLRVRNTFGPITVDLPAKTPSTYQIDVDARTAFGPVSVPNTGRSGGTFTEQKYHEGSTGPTLTIDVRDAFGPVTVGPPATTGSVPQPPNPPTPPSVP